ncbi:G1/S-specific cyclin Pcl5 [Zalerion maritima]|uniref:G1/S-specific cyclin Pcl5 n=1 Tax=Zalerion maritima TaxID=339359 RepID=A0AAD5RJR2_9PEZI|nr:G1/S-specific cyclin Pcl5 [Zalerion maritima]
MTMMQCGENNGSPAYIKSLLCNSAPYASSLATLASASSQSVCSDSSSQASDDSSSTSASSVSSSDSDSCDSYCPQSARLHRTAEPCDRPLSFSSPQWKQTVTQAAPEATILPDRRSNPRRTASRSGCPPPLVRQSDRKVNFVDSLVDSSTQIVETIWPLSSVACRSEMGSKGVLPLRTFIQETLRRSRTSYSTLQVALYYLILVKPHVPTHDFTMEQRDDVHSSRILQCGRRMFLAALILASKYLQDRNFSARAWSKISGLNTLEINQNEIAFLVAVNWKLHISDDVFQRWTEIVLKFTPHPQPPSPGASPLQQMCEPLGLDWRQVIRKLNPELDNVEGLVTLSPKPKREVVTPPTRAAMPLAQAESMDVASPIPRAYSAPLVMEPTPVTVYNTSGHLAPALGLLPTPRLTPQSSAYNTPAVSAASMMLSGKSSMGMAMAQASTIGAAQNFERWAVSNTSSPQCYVPARGSSLANSVSTASSPESMISDLSRTSRSSSISSASSLASAPSIKLDVQARCRYAKLCNERYMRPTVIAPVPEAYEENCFTSSPESYDCNGGKDVYDYDDLSGATDAARTLQSLAYTHPSMPLASPKRAGSKRSRTNSVDNGLQDNVRDLLRGSYDGESVWSGSLVRPRGILSNERAVQVPVRSPYRSGSKRLCCSAEALQGYTRLPSMHPVVGGVGGPGMWKGILDD